MLDVSVVKQERLQRLNRGSGWNGVRVMEVGGQYDNLFLETSECREVSVRLVLSKPSERTTTIVLFTRSHS